ncbi:MAG: succinyl-diaminopimelate desuccinylase [Gammaproteobacteria bacterium]|jgi:succinyl-diaminopimelate desuccinylase|nr:succinyl-diaminopimelate desuccinylase [Gammaproteobacteria bacterium]MBT5405979.1 succinyl-diaminopimelate desuccinylase [Gammaproteobacteria bacterium]MBT5644350.1 succinyl-diaminopimelate desuccinylase [Gammaproteobacteria bacterium]MBT5863186.1 succinyl-diaminopimelate desuccinylase [Gammaproteobacteria bacterium]MBT6734362.1 succinyl-diaminopimelate desuccinylase [Gammaproteobacteria bacterium]|tara:strand:- start:2995 stop:4128 length:1134 start_codon:yes stop_codon:yes gene_type:complete
MNNENVVEILSKLISCKSITPEDDGCQEFIELYLKNLGFETETKKHGSVINLIARYGKESPVFAYAGHTDVVPTGDLDKWLTNPFELTEIDSKLYGRGTSDMKGSVACILISIREFLNLNKDFKGSIVVILTSDEEGPAQNGIKKLVNDGDLTKHNIDMCLIGEPSCKKILGDTIKNGRRGSLSGKIIVQGIQGHVAYPHNAMNPIHAFSSTLKDLVNKKYDKGNKYFPPTTFQISNLNSGVGATNIIPGQLSMDFNFRYSTETTCEELMSDITKIMDSSDLKYSINWHHSGDPYLTEKKELLDICVSATKEILDVTSNISTDGGTSDGRFIAKICDQVIEFGLINESIHKINEHTTENDLRNTVKVYSQILKNIFN